MDDTNTASLPVNEIRDYHVVNAHLAKLLDSGLTRIRLTGVEGQRLLASGLRGPWLALIDVVGWAGPELAAALDAPGVAVVVRGHTADGAGRGLRAGSIVLAGITGDGVGYRQSGGTILALAGAGHRAGLELRGGLLMLDGPVGRLAGERMSGGRLVAPTGASLEHPGHGRRGGRLICDPGTMDEADRQALQSRRDELLPRLEPDLQAAVFERFGQVLAQTGLAAASRP